MSTPPVAKRVPTTRERHCDVVVDEYAWLQHKDDPEVIAYLEAENAYVESELADTESLQTELFEQIRKRIQETDLSVPVRKGAWWWYGRTEEGKQYGISCRKPVTDPLEAEPARSAIEQVVLDQNVEAGNSEFFSVGAFDTSPDHHLLAWSSDRAGA